MGDNEFSKMTLAKPGPYEADLPTIRLLKINWELAKLSKQLHEASVSEELAPDMGQCAAFGAAAQKVDELIDRCGLPAVPMKDVLDERMYFRWLLDNGYLDELSDIKARLQRIEEKLDGGAR